MQGFESIYEDYAARYIHFNGQEKYEKIYRKVSSSEKISGLFGRALHYNSAPTAMDILSCINTMPYFIFQGTPTCAMAALMVIVLWNEKINQAYHLCTDRELAEKAQSVFSILKMI